MPTFTFENKTVFYRQAGSGPLMVLLPGNTATSVCHDGEMAHFSERYTTVAIDFLGTGQSDRLDLWPVDWWQQNAHQVAALITQLNLGPAVLVGTSGGGISALWTAIHKPALVTAVIADSVPLIFTESLKERIVEDRSRHTAEQQAFWSYAQGHDWADVIAADNDMLMRFYDTNNGEVFGRQLRAVRCPVLFTASRQDSFLLETITESAERLRGVRNAHFHLAPDGAHPLMWTKPKLFKSLVDVFLHEYGMP